MLWTGRFILVESVDASIIYLGDATFKDMNLQTIYFIYVLKCLLTVKILSHTHIVYSNSYNE